MSHLDSFKAYDVRGRIPDEINESFAYDVGRAYAALHARTRQALADLIAAIYRRAGQPPPFPPAEMAQMILAIEAGIRLEQAAEPGEPGSPAAFQRLRDFVESPAPAGGGAWTTGRAT